MATFEEIDNFFNKLTDEFLKNNIPEIIAEKATAFFKERFTTKEWDDEPWPETKNPVKRGTLMVRSGALVASIKAKTVTPYKVVISAGSDKVNYARAHNEGETITVPVTPKMRRFAWAKYYEASGADIKTGKAGNVYQNVDIGKKANPWKGLALTKKESLTIRLPMRRFMGPSPRLNDVLFKAFQEEFNKLK